MEVLRRCVLRASSFSTETGGARERRTSDVSDGGTSDESVMAVGRVIPVTKKDWGGLRGVNDSVYFFGIVDCLQHYSFRRQLEHSVKSLFQSQEGMTIVNPASYAGRFQERFMSLVSTEAPSVAL